MDAATDRQAAKLRLATFLAGLEGGTLGVLWMLTWLENPPLFPQWVRLRRGVMGIKDQGKK